MINTFQLRVLGPIELVDRNGRNILSILAQPRRTALLAYLAIATEDGMEDRTRLVSLFWPDLNAEEGAARLDRAMHAIRRSLTRSSVLNDGNGRVGICRERVMTDVDDLKEAVESGDGVTAAELNRGRLLEAIDLPHLRTFTAWLETERALIRRAVATLDRAAQGRPSPVALGSSEAEPAEPAEAKKATDLTDRGVTSVPGVGSDAVPDLGPDSVPDLGPDRIPETSGRRRRFLDIVLRVG